MKSARAEHAGSVRSQGVGTGTGNLSLDGAEIGHAGSLRSQESTRTNAPDHLGAIHQIAKRIMP